MEILEAVDEINFSIKDLDIKDIVPNSIDGVLIAFIGEKCQIVLPDNVTGLSFKNWKNGKGGVFFNDVRNYFKNKKSGKYLLLENKEKHIIRLIEDEELELFNTLNLVHGKLKDKPYMNLRSIRNGEKLTSIKSVKEEIKKESKIIITDNTPLASKDSEDQGNVSLFED